MRKNKAVTWVLLLGTLAASHSQAKEGGYLVAQADASFLNMSAANRFFIPGRLPADLPEAPMGQGGRAHRVPGRVSRAKPRTPVIPAPRQTAEYRRTFKILASQPAKTDRYDALILKHSQRHQLDARFIKAIIAAESEFDADALSPRGAKGLMQVMPATARELGVHARNLHDPEANIRAGTAYFNVLFKTAWRKYKLKGVRYHDAPPWLLQRIIAAYNAGPRFLSSGRFYPQTRGYVRKVLLYYDSPVTEFHRATRLAYNEPQLDIEAGSALY